MAGARERGLGAAPRREGKTFFEKKVLPLKIPFPKNFSKGEKIVTNDE